ncbi:MAG: OadG family protein [Clostridia bacterium]|nr:OadG family protein [Clostridia bacterium]
MVINTYALTAQGSGQNVFSQAGIVSLMGMATIFVVLALLWAAVEIMHRVLHRDEKREKPVKAEKAAPVATVAPKTDDAAIAAAIAASLAAAEDNGALVAAITAAITAARAEAGETGAFRVVSFKRAERKRGYRR